MGETIWEWFKNKCEASDVFGKNVMPTYNTTIGGLTTISLFTLMAYLTVVQINSVVNYHDIKWGKNEKKVGLYNDPEIHHFTSGKGLKFAVLWLFQSGQFVDETYGQIELKQTSSYRCDDVIQNNICTEITVVPLEVCEISEFSNNMLNYSFSQPRLLWPPDDFDFTVQGNAFNDNYKRVELFFNVWNGVHCKPLNQAINALQNSIVNLYTMTQFFDFNDIDNPVKYHFDDNSIVLNSAGYNILEISVRKNEYTLNDNLLGLTNSESGVFYSFIKGSTTSFPSEIPLISGLIQITLDDQVDRYERSVATVIEAFGVIGGIYELFKVVFRLLFGIYTSKKFYREVSSIWMCNQDDQRSSGSVIHKGNQRATANTMQRQTRSNLSNQYSNNQQISNLNKMQKEINSGI